MKIAEKFHDNHDGTFVVESVFDNAPHIDRVEKLRELNPHNILSDSYMVGSVPMHLFNQWLKEAGVRWDDRDAAREILRQKLMSGEFSKLRVWEGTF
jgi:hypothetical protein